MRKIKQLLSIILILSLCATIPLETEAAKKNVTNSMKKNKYIKKISKDISTYTTCEMAERRSKKTRKEKLSGYNALSIAGYIGYQKGKFGYTKKELHKMTYNLFGVKPRTSSIPAISSSKRRWVSKSVKGYTNKPYMYSGGDWGDNKPKYTISKVIKVKKNVYDITIVNKLSTWDGYTDKTKTLGKTYMRVKKNPKSSYKFKIISLKYKGNGKGY